MTWYNDHALKNNPDWNITLKNNPTLKSELGLKNNHDMKNNPTLKSEPGLKHNHALNK